MKVRKDFHWYSSLHLQEVAAHHKEKDRGDWCEAAASLANFARS
jgi:hypothetical protein